LASRVRASSSLVASSHARVIWGNPALGAFVRAGDTIITRTPRQLAPVSSPAKNIEFHSESGILITEPGGMSE
jgi:hypothetical protein